MNPRFPAVRRPAILLSCMLLALVLWLVLRPAPLVRAPLIPIGPSRVKPQIVIQGLRVFVVAPDGSLWYWGSTGRPGNWVPLQRVGPDSDWAAIAPAAGGYEVAIKTNGTLWQWPRDRFGISAPEQLAPGTNWQAIAAGAQHTLALKTDGTLWAWGNNGFCQLGDGTTIARSNPVQVGSSQRWKTVSAGHWSSAALDKSGSLWVWGRGAVRMFSVPTQIGKDTDWTAVYADIGIVVRASDGSFRVPDLRNPTLSSFYPTTRGQFAWLPPLEAFNLVALSPEGGFGIKSDGTLWGTGSNSAGELGAGTKPQRGVPVRRECVQIGDRHDWVAIAASYQTSVGMTADGSVWAWGNRYDKPIHISRLKPRLNRWIRKLGIRYELGQSPFFSSPSPELVLRFVLAGTNAIISDKSLAPPAR